MQAKNVTASPGTTLVAACTPTGPELCFNAVDDNCNGAIDEGCGVQTGALQFTVAWGSSPADVNLELILPSGDRVNERARSTASGFHYDHDCPGEETCNGQNEENIHFEGVEPPRGRYVAEVKLVDLRGADSPVRARFGARLGARTVGFDVELAAGDEPKRLQFDL